jgi:hypothetical protein
MPVYSIIRQRVVQDERLVMERAACGWTDKGKLLLQQRMKDFLGKSLKHHTGNALSTESLDNKIVIAKRDNGDSSDDAVDGEPVLSGEVSGSGSRRGSFSAVNLQRLGSDNNSLMRRAVGGDSRGTPSSAPSGGASTPRERPPVPGFSFTRRLDDNSMLPAVPASPDDQDLIGEPKHEE